MRFRVMVKADKSSEAGVLPDAKQVFEVDDFGPALTPELREQEERLRKQAAKRWSRRPLTSRGGSSGRERKGRLGRSGDLGPGVAHVPDERVHEAQGGT